jgi:hypothetical protein
MKRCWSRQTVVLLMTCLALVAADSGARPALADEQSTPADPNEVLLIKPRFEAYAGSVHALIEAVQQSQSSAILSPLLSAWANQQQDDNEFFAQTTALLDKVVDWPDTSLSLATYAPDREGYPRWRLETTWPLPEVVNRLQAILEDPDHEDYFAGIRLTSADGGYAVRLKDDTLAYLRNANDHAVMTSHEDVPAPAGVYRGQNKLEDRPVLLACRRVLTQTETDSGGTFFSKLRFLTEFEYLLCSDDNGEWVELLTTSWPPVSGTVAKALLGRVRQTFFVPDESLLAAVFEITPMAALLDQMVGLGAQTTFSGGEVTVIGEQQVGVLAEHANSEMCLMLLPGTGFFPAPDVILLTRLSDLEGWHDAMHARTQELNREFVKREQDAPWNIDEVAGQTVYWREASAAYPGAAIPLVYRSVLFSAQETDARDRKRDYLVIGFTSTDPRKLVSRWNDLPRGEEVESQRYLPSERRTNGQAWFNYTAIYSTLAPYFNLALSGASSNQLLPAPDKVADSLSPGWATVTVSYTDAKLDHSGPAPLGVIAVPAMFFSAQGTGSSNSDLARERVAIKRLRLLYHHCKLFKQDIGRWPARVAELDGYVDFSGHPELLRLPRSSAQSWSDSFSDLFGGIFDEDSDDEDDTFDEGLGAMGRIDDSLYDIDWGKESWTLGYAEDSLEHLEKLWIDQDGKIHRIVRIPSEDKAESDDAEPGESSADSETPVAAQADANTKPDDTPAETSDAEAASPETTEPETADAEAAVTSDS